MGVNSTNYNYRSLIQDEPNLIYQPTFWYNLDLATASSDTNNKNTIDSFGFSRVYDLGTASVNILQSSNSIKGLYTYDSSKKRYMFDSNTTPPSYRLAINTTGVDYIDSWTVFCVGDFKEIVNSNGFNLFSYDFSQGGIEYRVSIQLSTVINGFPGDDLYLLSDIIKYEDPVSTTDSKGYIIATSSYIIHATGSTSEIKTHAYVNNQTATYSSVGSAGVSLSDDYIAIGVADGSKIGEVIFYNRILTSEEIDYVYFYLSNRWSI